MTLIVSYDFAIHMMKLMLLTLWMLRIVLMLLNMKTYNTLEPGGGKTFKVV
jgi:hypothetical protein